MSACYSVVASQLPVQSVLFTLSSFSNMVKYSASELLGLVDTGRKTHKNMKAALRFLNTTDRDRKLYQLWRNRKRCAQRQKRGKRAGVLARLRAN